MKKQKLIRIILTVVLIALLAFGVGLYVVEITTKGVDPIKNLPKLLSIVAVCIVGILRLYLGGGARRRGLGYYERQYEEYLKNAFSEHPMHRKKLLCAVRLYNEDKYRKAIKYLTELQSCCDHTDDYYAVGLFLGLVLTDMGNESAAVEVYNSLLRMGITSTTIYGNLGSLHSSLGNYDDAIACMHLSIQNDEKNPAPYNNLAKLYFDTYDFENAKTYAMKALEINHKMRQSATLLAIIHTLEGDAENAKKYSHIALASGESPERLQATIARYMAMKRD